jgi:methylthioribose-1-phosphate isomerase
VGGRDRPRNQGASLTAWELGQEGVPHTVIADNAGGHLMQHGQVDIVHRRLRPRHRARRRVQQDRHLPEGAGRARQRRAVLRGHAHLDAGPGLADGVREIPIEERSAREVTHLTGRAADGAWEVQLTPDGTPAANPAFDVTPARLVTGLITEHGVVPRRTS